MAKPAGLKGAIKQAAIAENRHNLTRPNEDPERWARALTTTRVADLFRTLPGLDGHWQALQGEVNAGNNNFFATQNLGRGFNDGGNTSQHGKELIKWIADAIIKAAKNTNFDFPMKTLQFTRDTCWLKLERTNGRVIVRSRP